MRETSLMTFFCSMMTSFQLKPLPPSLSIHRSHILELSAPSSLSHWALMNDAGSPRRSLLEGES